MKEKYIVKEQNGWWYKGKFYLEGTSVELTKTVYNAVKDEVKLEPVINKY